MKSTLPINGVHFLYKITNLVNGKAYIGVTCNPARRYKQHVSRPDVVHRPVNIAVHKYGVDSFSFKVVLMASREYVIGTEIKCISIYNTQAPLGYNISSGGETSLGSKWCASSRGARTGVNHHNALLSNYDLDFIIDSVGMSASEVAEVLGVCRSVVGQVRRGSTYMNYRPNDRGVDYGAATSRVLSEFQSGERSVRSVLTDNDVRDILDSTGTSSAVMADKYSVSTSAVYKIRHGGGWKHLKRPPSLIYKDGRQESRREYPLSITRNVFNKALSSSGLSSYELARLLGTSSDLILRIRNGKINKHSNFKKEN